MYAQLFCGANYLMYVSTSLKPGKRYFRNCYKIPPPPASRIVNLKENSAKN